MTKQEKRWSQIDMTEYPSFRRASDAARRFSAVEMAVTRLVRQPNGRFTVEAYIDKPIALVDQDLLEADVTAHEEWEDEQRAKEYTGRGEYFYSDEDVETNPNYEYSSGNYYVEIPSWQASEESPPDE